MSKFRQNLTELSARDTPIFSFPDDNLCKCQGILTKLGTCSYIKEIWFGTVDGQIPRHDNGEVLWFNFLFIEKKINKKKYFKISSAENFNQCQASICWTYS